MKFKKDEIRKVLKGKEPYAGLYKMKITGGSEDTKWMNLSRVQVKKILKLV